MKTSSVTLILGIIGLSAMIGCVGQSDAPSDGELSELRKEIRTANAQIAAVKKDLEALQALVPDQAAVMARAGYHFNALWFAIQKSNWPLADFYLSETFANLRWAVRVKPIRKDTAGRDVKLGDILKGIENTQLVLLKDAIKKRDKSRCEELYRVTLGSCYSCHKASDKPFLRPRVPEHPEVGILEFDENTK